jgi:hypothetical protein
MDTVFELLTGTGLAASSGLNAWIPLLTVGLLARYTDLVTLPASWDWIGDGWVLAGFGLLLAIEFFADKIPGVDSLNDLVHTAIRPTSGGIVFAAGSAAETAAISDPGALFEDRGWVPIVAGMVIALIVHALKAAIRPVLNALTGCLGGPVASTVEDATSVAMSVVALLVPILVIGFLAGLVILSWWGLRRRARRKRERRALRAGGSPRYRSPAPPRS